MPGTTKEGEPSSSQILEAIDKLTVTLTEVDKNVKFCKEKLGGHEKRIKALENVSTINTQEISKAHEKNEKMSESLTQLQISFEKMKQRQLKNFVDILGVPKINEEKLIDVVINIGKVAGINVLDKDVVDCYRLPARENRNEEGDVFHPTIVVEFLKEQMKLDIMMGLKERKTALVLSEIGFLETTNVYVNEKLTAHLKRVLMEAKRSKKDGLLKYAWGKFGKVMGRIDDGSPTLVFWSVKDIEAAIEDSLESGESMPVRTNIRERKRKPKDQLGQPPPKRGTRATKNSGRGE